MQKILGVDRETKEETLAATVVATFSATHNSTFFLSFFASKTYGNRIITHANGSRGSVAISSVCDSICVYVCLSETNDPAQCSNLVQGIL